MSYDHVSDLRGLSEDALKTKREPKIYIFVLLTENVSETSQLNHELSIKWQHTHTHTLEQRTRMFMHQLTVPKQRLCQSNTGRTWAIGTSDLI
jgi:hypothetical protein